jgi:predicted permease
MTDVYARLRPDVSLAAARAEMDGIARRLHAQYPADYPPARGFEIRLTPWRDVLVRDARTTLWMLMGTVALVLVVAIANVGNLTLTCLIRRERELSVRAALGAPPRELRTHLLAEHAMLAIGGAIAGVVIAWLGLRQLVDYTARLTLRAAEVEINGVVLGFSLAIAVAAALLFAWTPRLPGAGGAMSGAVGGEAGRRTTQGRRHRRAQKLLVAGQVALSFIVLAGAGLLIRSLINLQRVDVGFELGGVTTLKAPNYSRWPLPRNRAMFDDVVDRLSRMPGVLSAATATSSPFDATEIYSWRYRTDGRQSGEQASSILFNTVSSGYFRTLDIPMRRGRGFEATDGAGGEPVVVISERFGQLAFPDESPIGRRVQWSFDGQQWSGWRTIVGVAADTRDRGPQRAVVPTIYQASTQVAPGPALLIRTSTETDGMAAAREATRIIREQDPKRPIVDVTTLEDALAKLIAPSRLNATLFGGFGLLALGIAAVGVGGVLAFAVSERTREFGIRAALGATRGRILRAVIAEGLALTAGGLAVGALGGVALTRLLEGLLFDVQPLDVASFTATAALIAGVAVVASWLPARGATRVDPAVVLRAE